MKNQKAAMEKSTEEIKEMHKKQLIKLGDEINLLKETIKRWQFENELLSDQYKTITNELMHLDRLVCIETNYFLIKSITCFLFIE